MFLINVLAGDIILERVVLNNLREAYTHAVKLTREKVWHLGDDRVYYGNVESRVYDITTPQSSDHEDEHILSFFGSV